MTNRNILEFISDNWLGVSLDDHGLITYVLYAIFFL